MTLLFVGLEEAPDGPFFLPPRPGERSQLGRKDAGGGILFDDTGGAGSRAGRMRAGSNSAGSPCDGLLLGGACPLCLVGWRCERDKGHSILSKECVLYTSKVVVRSKKRASRHHNLFVDAATCEVQPTAAVEHLKRARERERRWWSR